MSLLQLSILAVVEASRVLEPLRLGSNPGAATCWGDVARGCPAYLGLEADRPSVLSLPIPNGVGSRMSHLNSKPVSLVILTLRIIWVHDMIRSVSPRETTHDEG